LENAAGSYEASSELCSGNTKNHIPFGKLCENIDEFIDDRYFPSNFAWKDPRNMTKDAIIQLCDHIRQRQDQNGPEGVFRFKAYFDGKNMVEAVYGTRSDEERAAARSRKQQKARKENRAKGKTGKKKKPKGKGKETQPLPSPVASQVRSLPAVSNDPPIHAVTDGETRPCGVGNSRTSQCDDSVIDPVLLGDQVARNHEPAVQDENPDDPTGHFIDDAQMQILIQNGYSCPIPVNGPNDGLPRYFVPAAAIQMLRKINNGTNCCKTVIDPSNDHPNTNQNRKGTGQKDNITPNPRRSSRVQRDKSKNASVVKGKKTKVNTEIRNEEEVEGLSQIRTRSQKKGVEKSRRR
jgi:hypothetical protein